VEGLAGFTITPLYCRWWADQIGVVRWCQRCGETDMGRRMRGRERQRDGEKDERERGSDMGRRMRERQRHGEEDKEESEGRGREMGRRTRGGREEWGRRERGEIGGVRKMGKARGGREGIRGEREG